MNTIRKFVYAALVVAAAINLGSSPASAQETARGKFKLTHDVYWGNASVPAGEYEFSFDPYQSSSVLTLTKMSGPRAGFMLLVTNSEVSKVSDSNQLLLETVDNGSYVSTMQLAECGMTLHFAVPSHPVKQMAKAVATVAPSGQ